MLLLATTALSIKKRGNLSPLAQLRAKINHTPLLRTRSCLRIEDTVRVKLLAEL